MGGKGHTPAIRIKPCAFFESQTDRKRRRILWSLRLSFGGAGRYIIVVMV